MVGSVALRRAVAVAIAVAVAGCGRIGFDPGGPGDAGRIDARGDAPIDADPAGDDDGDGVDNASDNCPAIANPGQHDEDADARGDVCDNCPGIANVDQADTEAAPDGVGDACDPRPADGGDQLLAFDPFVGAVFDPRWSALTGTWTLVGDAVEQSTGVTDAELVDASDQPTDRLLIETRITFTGFAGTGDHNASVMLELDTTAGFGWVAGVFLDEALAAGALKIWRMDAGTAGNPIEVVIAPPVVGGGYVVQAGNALGRVASRLLGGGPAVSTVDSITAGAKRGLRTNRAQARYHYYALYGLGGALP